MCPGIASQIVRVWGVVVRRVIVDRARRPDEVVSFIVELEVDRISVVAAIRD